MRKRTLLAFGTIAIIISFMAWDIYENKKKETAAIAQAEKIYTTSDILKDADFNVEETAFTIRPFPYEENEIVVENNEQRKQIIEKLANLKLQESTKSYPFKNSKMIQLKLNKEYDLFLFEKEKNIYFPNSENSNSYDIVDGDDFFELLTNVSQ